MLKEIKCNLFTEKILAFKPGLNTIVGDSVSTNSIGKSTLLMIIDFVFGGNSYLQKNSGSIKELGALTFYFCFEFEKNLYRFSRNTESPERIEVCNVDYKPISQIDIDEYTDLLKSKYAIINALSFRAIVGVYSRIWGKDNNNVNKPLQSFLKEPESTSITVLIKLFNKYESISQTEKSIKSKVESKRIIEGIHNKNYVERVTKTQFKANEVLISEKKNQINDIKDNLLQFTLNIEELTGKEIIKLKTEKSKLLEVQNVVLNKIKRLELNLEGKSVKSKYFQRLSSFFESPNEKKIEEIETFHDNITAILKKEINSAIKVLQEENFNYTNRIAEIDNEISQLLKNVDSPKFIIEKLYDLTIEINKLETTNRFYSEKFDVIEDLSRLNDSLSAITYDILREIESLINTELIKINKIVHSEAKKIPRLILNKKNYSFDHSGDTGTGKSYSDLIEFDLAILNLTSLPFLIHDSPLFKNIGDLIFQNIIALYGTIKKQIFIAVDGIEKFDTDTIDLIESKKVIQLADKKQLFIKDWRIK
ncbi:DUF2326 domain-containing protein [Pedobacter sp. WC2501]|uniref:DUF2326 domain-containing protein n=1 Tax=Pedobacter sp. WC2501 TaxID=3461400 RepID=UPI004045AD50